MPSPRLAALALFVFPLLLNEWTVASFLSPDGELSSATRAVVWLADLAALGLGAVLWSRRGGKPRRGTILLLAVSTVMALVLGEVALRLFGFTPFQPADPGIEIEPGGSLYRPHPTLGYTHLPGRFTVTLQDGYSFHLTHRGDTLRVTRPLESYASDPARPGLWIFGCSFTHGWSVDDAASFPWLVQAARPDLDVVNFGVVGYGNLHSLIQFRDALARRSALGHTAPRIVVATYGSFHDHRNTFARTRRKVIAPYNRLGPLVQPYARLAEDGDGFRVAMAKVEYRRWPFMSSSALVHFLEESYNQLERRRLHGDEVSRRVLVEFAREAWQRGIDFVVAGIYDDPATRRMLEELARSGVETVDLAFDSSDHAYLNLPHDPHPGPLGHRHYAKGLLAWLAEKPPP